MGYTNKGLLEHAIKCYELGDKSVYILGEFGRKVTQSTIDQKCTQSYVKDFNLPRKVKYENAMNKYSPLYAFDCVGLIKSYYWGYPNIKYDSKTDVNESMMLSRSKMKGKIATLPQIEGALVVMKGHIGIYDGKGYVYECTPNTKFAKQSHGLGGVCKTKLSDRVWTDWCYCPYIEYKIDSNSQNKPIDNDLDNKGIIVGCKVKVSKNAKYYANTSKPILIPQFVKNRIHTVGKINGNKALLKEIFSWVLIDDLERV